MNFQKGKNQFNVMLIGNNPKELSDYSASLINEKKIRFVTDVSFDLTKSIQKIVQNKPGYILVDDLLGIQALKKFISELRSKSKTEEIPIALLKSSNKRLLLISGIQDYLLKDNFSAERLYYSIMNSRKIRRTQIFLYKTYKKSIKHYNVLLKSIGKRT